MARNTARITDLKNAINLQITNEKTESGKMALCTSLENILHASGNYRGFGYNLTPEQWHYLWNDGNVLSIDYAIEQGWITEYDRNYY